jgi:hypothetical protein
MSREIKNIGVGVEIGVVIGIGNRFARIPIPIPMDIWLSE